ncbi:MAG: hypothetical protein QG637_1346 [Chloroflexota bacterium]|nr:hypothetical protein [Chloroflexota bacterium]
MSRWTMAALLVATVLLAGCGSAAQPATPQAAEPFMLALPRIVVTVDAAGNLSILGLSPALFGMDARFPQPLLDTLIAANVQHLEARILGRGLVIYVNGKPLPHIGWDDAALTQGADFAQAMMGQDLSTVKKLLPIVRRLGLDVVVRLPKKAGAADLPLISLEEGAKIVPQTAAGPATAIVKLDAKIDNQGVPLIFDLTAADFAAFGMAAPSVLDADTLKRLQGANIQHLLIRSKPGGLFIYVNGKALPHLVWDSQFLTNAAELFGQLMPDSPYIPLVTQIAPGLDRADIDVLVLLPPTAGAATVPLPQR